MHFFIGQTAGAQLVLALSVFDVVTWGAIILRNHRWLERANGTRPFIRGYQGLGAGYALLACIFLVNAMLDTSIPGGPYEQTVRLMVRLIVGIMPLNTVILARQLDGEVRH